MEFTECGQSSVSDTNRPSQKRKHEDDGGDVETILDTGDENLGNKELIISASYGDLNKIKDLKETGVADITYQDPDTGLSAMMVAAREGHSDVVQYLLTEGAPWNAVDFKYRCSGDYAALNGHQEIVDLIMNHAVTSELLLSAFRTSEIKVHASFLPNPAPKLCSARNPGSCSPTNPIPMNSAYLSSRLEYTPSGDRLVDTSSQLAVMMDWEKPLMEQHAEWICFADVDPSKKPISMRTLNVGFGMGIADEAIMNHSPAHHTIIEAHPQVIDKMETDGWMRRENVRVCAGRWQDVVPQLVQEIESGIIEPFNGVFFDTYAEDDLDLTEFHEYLPRIMAKSPYARYSYYNGMCPDSVFFHGVACETTRLRLQRLGFSCNFKSIPVPDEATNPETWRGLSNRYWNFDTYFLPQCSRED